MERCEPFSKKKRIEILDIIFDMRIQNRKNTSGSKSNTFHSKAEGGKTIYTCKKCNKKPYLKEI